MRKNDENPLRKILNPRAFKFSIKPIIDRDLKESSKIKTLPYLRDSTRNKIKDWDTQVGCKNNIPSKLKDKISEILKYYNSTIIGRNRQDILAPTVIKLNESLSNLPKIFTLKEKSPLKKNNEKF